jgi:hypothetical protein
VELFNERDDDLWFVALMQAGEAAGVPLVAAGDVHMHARSRKPLHDVLTAVREGKTVAECGFALQSNAERHLRARMRLAGLYLPEHAGEHAGGDAALHLRPWRRSRTTSTRSNGASAMARRRRRRWCARRGRARTAIPEGVFRPRAQAGARAGR